MQGHWRPGDHVLARDIHDGRIKAAIPVVVVQDTAEQVVLWISPGTRFLVIGDAAGRPTHDFLGWTQLVESAWQPPGSLTILMPGAAHSVKLRWQQTGELLCWYINLEAPFRRTPLGFDSEDHLLDVLVAPDGRSHQFKDAAELRLAVESSYFTEAEAAGIRAEADRAIRRAREWARPFCDGWEQFTPDPIWSVPSLPQGWDRI